MARSELDPPATLSEVAVRAGGGGHPFFYRKMVEGHVGGPRPQPGDVVRIVDRDGRPFGYGLFNPRSQIVLRLLSTAPTPPGAEFWRERLGDAVKLRRDLLGLDEVANAYRVVHAEGDGLSGLIVDRFGDVLSAEAFSLGIYQRLGPILDELAAMLGTTQRIVRVDDWVIAAEGIAVGKRDEANPLERTTIHEHGVRYRINFATGHKTGFFCDQRDNRKEFARQAKGKDVLDVCCYSGGFALAARVAGDAREVTGIDLDEKAIAMARENANLNQARVQWAHADAFGYMRQMGLNGRKYGLVALDPPKLILDRDEMSPGKRKYYDLNVLAMRLVEPGGTLLTCSCSGLLSLDAFLGIVRAAARESGIEAQVLGTTGASPDHPVSLQAPEGAYLKAVWLRIVRGRPPIEGPAPEPEPERHDEPETD